MSTESRRRILVIVLVFVVALITLGWHLSTAGIAEPFSDPVAKIRAQDEAPYVDSAIRMAKQGDWMTPHIMGRMFLQKPPLLFWLTALSIEIFGVTLAAVRLPALILGAAGVAAIFAWCWAARGLGAGILAAGLLVLSPFWQIFSRLCYTDIPSIACAVLAMTVAALDPKLEKRATPILFGACGALSILAKSVAGVLPFAALGLCWLLPAERRPRFARLLQVGIAAIVVLIPWHVYQARVHPEWFWADYIQLQLLGVGLQQAKNSIFARPTWFYLDMLRRMDPAVALLALAAIPGLARAVRRREDAGVMLAACWTLVTFAALSAFQAKNLPYMVFLLPPLCVLAALCGPRVLWRRPIVAAAIVAGLFAVKVWGHGAVWSLEPASVPLEGAAAMRSYYNLHRNAELMDCQLDDEFYSSTIPLPRVRYCFVDPEGGIARSAPHYAMLGIVMPSREFVEMPAVLPTYWRRLRAWGLDSIEPIGTTITLRAPADIAAMLAARPDMDFYLPAEWEQFAGSTHRVMRYSTTRVFLLSRTAAIRRSPIPDLPRGW